MDESTRELLSGFRASNKFSWKVVQSEVEAVVERAAESADVELLLAFLSMCPDDDPGTGPGPGMVWASLCWSVVLPTLGEHPTSSTADAICAVLRDHTPRYEEFSTAAYGALQSVIQEEAFRTAALESVCNILVDECYGSVWRDAIGLLQSEGYVAAVPHIVAGATRTDYSGATKTIVSKNSTIQSMDITAAIQSIMAFDPPDMDQAISTMLGHRDMGARASVVKALGRYGNRSVVPALKRRLGGLFSKPESASYIRELIKSAIEEINGRAVAQSN
jgi:hypothetical protein